MIEHERLAALERFLAGAARAQRVRVESAELLKGGAIQENYLLDAHFDGGRYHGALKLALRMSAPSAVAASHTRAQEYALLKAVHAQGVAVPEPLFLCEDPAVLGRPFFVMRAVAGTALGPRIVKDTRIGGDRDALARRLGRELARIHRIRPPRRDLAFLAPLETSPARHLIALYRGYLDALDAPRPVVEWGLRWLQLNAYDGDDVVLCHRDFRTGNYMVDAHGLTGILDWEFAGWGDPMEDIAWFCSRSWRFSAPRQEAGGIAGREPFYAGYTEESGTSIDAQRVHYWEVMASVRWAVIALQQNRRYTSGEQRTLELALIGRRVPEMEFEILKLIDQALPELGHAV